MDQVINGHFTIYGILSIFFSGSKSILHVFLAHVHWCKARWNRSCWCDSVSEVNTLIGKLGSQDSVHWVIERRYFEVSEKHLNWLIVFSTHLLQVSWRSHYHIYNNILVCKSLILASVYSREDIDIPNSWAIKVVRTKYICWREESSKRNWSIESIMKVLTLSDIVGTKFFISSWNNINDTHIKISCWCHLSKFFS